MATRQQLRDAAYTAVAVAAIADRDAHDTADRERATFRHVLRLALSHGLHLTDLADASGLDEPYLTRVLTEAGDL